MERPVLIPAGFARHNLHPETTLAHYLLHLQQLNDIVASATIWRRIKFVDRVDTLIHGHTDYKCM